MIKLTLIVLTLITLVQFQSVKILAVTRANMHGGVTLHIDITEVDK